MGKGTGGQDAGAGADQATAGAVVLSVGRATQPLSPQMPGRSVSGFCPLGCGQTLVLAAGACVTCMHLDCPRPDAAAELLNDQETEHVVKFGETTFTVRHPLRERLDDALMDCDLHKDIAAMDGPPVPPGTYRARWADYDAATPGYGRWTWEPLP